VVPLKKAKGALAAMPPANVPGYLILAHAVNIPPYEPING
jgi:hypothetical protein